MDNVIIRSSEELKHTKTEIQKALIHQCGSDKKFPLVYKYPGGDDTLKPSENDVIGSISNIHINPNGDIVCSVETYPLLQKSIHFVGKIDNVLVGMERRENNDDLTPILISGIVYDKFVKSLIDQRRAELDAHNNQIIRRENSPTDGNIGVDSDYNPLVDPRVKNSIRESMVEKMKGGDL